MYDFELVKENEINRFEVDPEGNISIRTYGRSLNTVIETKLDGLRASKVKNSIFYVPKKQMSALKELFKNEVKMSIEDKLIIASNGVTAKIQYATEETDADICTEGEIIPVSIDNLRKARKFIKDDSLRAVLRGVHVKSSEANVIIEVTDGFKLFFTKEVRDGANDIDVIIPFWFIDSLIDDMKLFYNKNSLIGKNDKQIISSKKIEGNYPDLSRIIKYSGQEFEIELDEMRNICLLAQKMGGENILFQDGLVICNTKENSLRKEISILPKICLNISNILITTGVFKDKARCSYNGDNKPIVFWNDKITSLVLPMKIEE